MDILLVHPIVVLPLKPGMLRIGDCPESSRMDWSDSRVGVLELWRKIKNGCAYLECCVDVPCSESRALIYNYI